MFLLQVSERGTIFHGRYMKGYFFKLQMVFKRVRVCNSVRSLPVLNFAGYPRDSCLLGKPKYGLSDHAHESQMAKSLGLVDESK